MKVTPEVVRLTAYIVAAIYHLDVLVNQNLYKDTNSQKNCQLKSNYFGIEEEQDNKFTKQSRLRVITN